MELDSHKEVQKLTQKALLALRYEAVRRNRARLPGALVGGPGVRHVVVVRVKLVSLVCGLFPVGSVGNAFCTAARNAIFFLLFEMRFYVWGGWGVQVWGMFPVGSVGREKVWWFSSALLSSSIAQLSITLL